MPFDDDSPVMYAVGLAGFHAMGDGNVMLSFVTPVPGKPSEPGQNVSLNLRTSARIVMSAQAVAQLAAFLGQAFPNPGPAPERTGLQ